MKLGPGTKKIVASQRVIMRKTKCLFISHVPVGGLQGGGAGNSLLTFLQHQASLDIDLVMPLFIGHFPNWPKTIRNARQLKGSTVGRIFLLPLPFDLCFEGAQTSLRARSAYKANNVIAALFLPLLKRIMRRREYHFVCLNSLVLHQLLSRDIKCALHVREVLDFDCAHLLEVIKNLRRAAGLIFIDSRTRQAVDENMVGSRLPCHRIVNNPFEMRAAQAMRFNKSEIRRLVGIRENTGKTYVYLGNLHPVKGVDLIIKAFTAADTGPGQLLIVGAGNPDYVEHCRFIAQRSGKDIYFLGRMEFSEVKKIYAVSDYVVRGDPDFRIGRTLYEALYSGGAAIMPGCPDDLKNEPGLLPFASRIIFYAPGSIDSLAEAIRTAGFMTFDIPADGCAHGNMIEHCLEMNSFFQTCILGSAHGQD